jgi:transposase
METEFQTIFARCAFLDVHKQTVEATVRILEGERVRQDTRRWGTMTADLEAMADWMAAQGVTQVGMESTGVFWEPIYNILESRFTVILVNARHLKQVKGRKSDVRDSQWGAQLLQFGLLRPSFIPPRWQRELRDLTRHRSQLVAEQTRVANRIHKVLEDANLKLGSVATDILGVTGRAIIRALIEGEEDGTKLANLAQGKLRNKLPELRQALQGRLTDHHRFMLRQLWDELEALEKLMAKLQERIAEATRPYASQIQRMDPVPGVDRRVAEVVLAEVGPDLSPFPTDAHVSSWSGMSPGSNESAGKQRSTRTTKGNRWLRAALVQAAWAASHSKNTYLAAQYRRLVGRRGKKRALVAVGHSILVILYHLLKDETPYSELGGNYFDRLQPERLTRYHVRRLEQLGHKVTLEPCTT